MKFSGPRILVAAACLACGGRAPALGQLADTSPFLPAGVADSGGTAGAPGSLELRGIMSTSEGMLFCIYDPVKKSSAWVALNETGHDYVVRSSDPANDRVTLESRGQVLTLVLRASKTAAMTASGREPPGVNMPPGVNPADEAARLEAISKEVRRRRMLREQVEQAQQRADRQNGLRGPPQ